MSITIFNLAGQPVRHILSQEYVGTQACYSWMAKMMIINVVILLVHCLCFSF